MNQFEGIENVCFIGIGGIGMSALARYMLPGGFRIFGYDRTCTELTRQLENEGCRITYDDDPGNLPLAEFSHDNTLVIYTPAIPSANTILTWFTEKKYRVLKRAQVLGIISKLSRTIAIAGTHGKTSVSTLLAHLLKQSSVDCTAFLGGISSNYDTNLLTGGGDIVVMEADEYDRSFLELKPECALVTSLDPDHLEVYGDYENMIVAFNQFVANINSGGAAILNFKIAGKIKTPQTVKSLTYGFDSKADFSISKSLTKDGYTSFTVTSPYGVIEDLETDIPGKPYLENSLAAIAVALTLGLSGDEIRRALVTFRGVRRRFDIRLRTSRVTYIDDYAHHPAELDFLINCLREHYGESRITGIFQPHLFTRTRDHAASFATSLDRLDRVLIMPIYPAREEPIEGVSSKLIFDRMNLPDKHLVTPDKVLQMLRAIDTDILVTIGAGDIDRLARPIINLLREEQI